MPKFLDKQVNDSTNVCVKCGENTVAVMDSRPHQFNPQWRKRRRLCASCNHKWTTLEVPEEVIRMLPMLQRQVDRTTDLMIELRGELRNTIGGDA